MCVCVCVCHCEQWPIMVFRSACMRECIDWVLCAVADTTVAWVLTDIRVHQRVCRAVADTTVAWVLTDIRVHQRVCRAVADTTVAWVLTDIRVHQRVCPFRFIFCSFLRATHPPTHPITQSLSHSSLSVQLIMQRVLSVLMVIRWPSFGKIRDDVLPFRFVHHFLR
jgi:hypothetical protein